MGKKVLVASGTSEHKKQYAVEAIQRCLAEKGISDVEVKAENVYTVNVDAEKPDLIVLIGPNRFQNTGIPIVQGNAYITRIIAHEKKTCEEIAGHLLR